MTKQKNHTERVFKNFKTACQHYKFPGSHQRGSYGPKGKGIVRSYSNGTPGKDHVAIGKKGQKTEVLYKLKDEGYREKFSENITQSSRVRFFRKVESGVEDLGLFEVTGFTETGHVKMINVEPEP